MQSPPITLAPIKVVKVGDRPSSVTLESKRREKLRRRWGRGEERKGKEGLKRRKRKKSRTKRKEKKRKEKKRKAFSEKELSVSDSKIGPWLLILFKIPLNYYGGLASGKTY